MGTEKIGFRTRLFGGFNREDVAASIERISAERNALKKRVQELEDQISALTEEAARARADATQAIQAAAEAAVRAENAQSEAVRQAAETLSTLNTQYTDASGELAAAVQATQTQLHMIGDQLSALTDKLAVTGSRIGQLAEDAAAPSAQSLSTEEHPAVSEEKPADDTAPNAVPDAVKSALSDLGLDAESLLGTPDGAQQQ